MLFSRSIALLRRPFQAGLPAANPLPRRFAVQALVVGIAMSLAASESFAGCGTITFDGVQPAGKPAFGQTVMLTGRVYDCSGRPAAGVLVQLWFSGRHGVRAGTHHVFTDAQGRYSAIMTIPRAWVYGWGGEKTWVDLNVACPVLGISKLFRVRDK